MEISYDARNFLAKKGFFHLYRKDSFDLGEKMIMFPEYMLEGVRINFQRTENKCI